MEILEYRLLLDLNRYHLNVLRQKVVERLQSMTDACYLMSGDDSGLKSTWEEYCVQVQGEESVHWEVFDDTVYNICADILDAQDWSVKQLISYINRDERNSCEEEGSAAIAYDERIAVRAVKGQVDYIAAEFSNARIEQYLHGEDEEEEEYEDED